MGTVRQKMMELLKLKPTDAQALSRALGISQRAVEAHLEHVAKSSGVNFIMTAAACRDCDFTFSSRTRMTKPTKCPTCNGEDILPPFFSIN